MPTSDVCAIQGLPLPCYHDLVNDTQGAYVGASPDWVDIITVVAMDPDPKHGHRRDFAGFAAKITTYG